jgi:HSP20 family molecular chaperone IbpA
MSPERASLRQVHAIVRAPGEVEHDTIDARYANSVRTIVVPRAASPRRRIEITGRRATTGNERAA